MSPPLIDVHVHLGPSDSDELFYPEVTPGHYRRLAAEAGIVRAYGFAPFRHDGYRRANAELAESLADDELLRPFARLGGRRLPLTRPEAWMARRKLRFAVRGRAPDLGDPSDLERFAGVKLLPHLDGLPAARELGAIDALRLPVVVHSGLHTPPRWVERELLPFLGGTVILAHLGAFPVESRMLDDAIDVAYRYPNAYLDTSGVWDREFFRRAADRVADKLLFGSDCPLTHPLVAWRHLQSAISDPEVLEAVGSGNAAAAGLAPGERVAPAGERVEAGGPGRGPAAPAHVPPAVRILDQAASRLRVPAHGGGAAPVSAELSRRSLWGHLRRLGGAPPDPTGDVSKRLALSFDLDYHEDSELLDDLCDVVGSHEARMSVVAIGRLVERAPDPYRRALEAGHELVNHTYDHPDNPVLCPDRTFTELSEAELREQILLAQDAFERELGVRPHGFRSPHFKDSHRLTSVLEEIPEISYSSSVLASQAPSPLPFRTSLRALAGERSYGFSSSRHQDNSRVLQIPLTPCPEHRWSPFDTHHAIRAPRDRAAGVGLHGVGDWERLWARMLSDAAPLGFASVYFDPIDVLRDAETRSAFSRMLSRARDEGWSLIALEDVESAYAKPAGASDGRAAR